MSVTKQEAIEAIRLAVTDLTESPLYAYRTENNYLPVIGDGNLDAEIMFIGEAPGESEAKKGKPFVGASGRFLDELLASVGIPRDSIYITNVVKDRPPNNRNPHKKEIALYSPFLRQQIEIIQPKVIATLGRFAMEFVLTLLDSPAKGGQISKLHGEALKATANYGEIWVVPLFHPAVALYNVDQKQTLIDDFRVLRRLVTTPTE